MSSVERGLARGVLAAAILLFIPGFLDPFDSPKAIVLRIVGLCALAAVLLDLFADPGSWTGAIRDRLATGRTALAVDVGVASWAVASLISTAGSVSPRLSVLGELQQREGLLTTLALVGLYATLRRSHRDTGQVRTTIHVLLGSAAVAAGYGVVQFMGHDPLAWAGTTHIPSGSGVTLRAFGTLGNPILLGAVLAPALGIVTARLVTEQRRVFGWSALAGLLSIGLITTLSRGAWLAAACGVIAAVAGAMWYRVARPVRGGRLALLAAALAPAVVVLWLLRGAVLARAGESLTADGGTAQVRREIARAALALWQGRPWFGTGPDTFGLLFPRVQPLAYGGGLWNGLPIQAHSVPLQALATTGVVGALAGTLWIAAVTATLVTRPPTGPGARAKLELAAGAVSLLVFGVFNHVGIAGAAWFVALSALLIRSGGESPGGAYSPPGARGRVGLVFALAIALTWNAVPEIEALAAAGRARAALEESVGASGERRRTLVRAAAAEASDAAAHAPGEDELWRSACIGGVALGREALHGNDFPGASAAFDRAEESARRAIGLEPLRASNFQALGNALALRAHIARLSEHPAAEVAAITAQSDSAFAEAKRRAPLDARVLIDQARGQLELGRAAEARITAQRIVQLYPDAATGYSLLAAAQLMLGDRPAAARSLRAAVRGRWLEDHGADEVAAKGYLQRLESPDSTR
jgi:O-antigen ligase